MQPSRDDKRGQGLEIAIIDSLQVLWILGDVALAPAADPPLRPHLPGQSMPFPSAKWEVHK